MEVNAYAEVIEWSRTLPTWQRDALRRLALSASLPPADLEQLIESCIAEANQQVPEPALLPIDEGHLPARSDGKSQVTLAGISACSSLNAIPDGQQLTFAPAGLTIIYGDNGTGKSGYVRVLRHACRARGLIDAVLPDVYAPQSGSPAAHIDYLANGDPRSFAWAQGGTPSPEELHPVAVFDSAAAVALLERENEVLWTPGGLDLLVRLAAVVDEVRGRLQQAVGAVSAPGPLPQVPAGTSAATFLGQLTPSTAATEIDAQALRPEEQEELKRLDAALAAPDPASVATQLRQRAQRFRALRDRVSCIETGLNQAALQQLTELRTAYKTSAEAERLLASQTFGDSLIPGVGDGSWRALWDAAERYARSGATADGLFPSADQPGRCVLCQQPLDDTSRDRLERFNAFVRADVAQRRTKAADALRRKISEVKRLQVREYTDDALIQELTGIHAEEGQNIRQLLDAAAAAMSTIAGLAPEVTEWRMPEPIPTGWPAWLDGIIADTEAQAAAMLGAATPDQAAASHARRNELLARQALVTGRRLIEDEVQRLARLATLERAITGCVTTGITRKAGELTRVHVSVRLMQAFDAEAEGLRLPVTVKYRHSRNEKGTSYQRVAIEAAPWAEKASSPVLVLSEGERRAVALAAFLAEVTSREDRSGVVLDDPVSSLDHERRHAVAKRLVELASDRQVIIFTHDLVFLHMLKTAADEAGIGVTDREVRRTVAASGLCRDKPPAKAMRIKALVGELKERQQRCATAHNAGKEEEYETQLANTFGLLREGWERAVEELLLNQAVTRFDYRVQTNRLRILHDITEADLAEIDAGMSVCSKWLPGHSLAPAINDPLPSPDELLAEILRLESFMKAMRKRGRS